MKKTLGLLLVLGMGAPSLFAGAVILETQVRAGERLLLPAVSIPYAFKTTNGKTLPAGVYDLEILGQGSNKILIGLVRAGQRQGELLGNLKGSKAWGDPHESQGAGAPPSVKQAGDGSVRPGGAPPATFRDLGFQSPLKSSFTGDGLLKIEPANANGLIVEIAFPKAPPVAGKLWQKPN